MMALRIIMTFSTLLLMTSESGQTAVTPNREIYISAPSNSTGEGCSCPTSAAKETVDATSSPNSSPPALGLLNITWKACSGEVKLILHHPSSSLSPVCHDKEIYVQHLFGNVCKNKKGCQGEPHWLKGQQPKQNGYYIKENGTYEEGICDILKVACRVAEPPPDVQGQLKAFKVVTALMSCVLLLLLLIRFTRPTVKALQKRLSDKRQNRWIGPTQSHSVSYHRGKTAVKNNDREKRLSYPALERLTVSDSREPSSNRNSDCNF